MLKDAWVVSVCESGTRADDMSGKIEERLPIYMDKLRYLDGWIKIRSYKLRVCFIVLTADSDPMFQVVGNGKPYFLMSPKSFPME
jgi:hypothetical protein